MDGAVVVPLPPWPFQPVTQLVQRRRHPPFGTDAAKAPPSVFVAPPPVAVYPAGRRQKVGPCAPLGLNPLLPARHPPKQLYAFSAAAHRRRKRVVPPGIFLFGPPPFVPHKQRAVEVRGRGRSVQTVSSRSASLNGGARASYSAVARCRRRSPRSRSDVSISYFSSQSGCYRPQSQTYSSN